MRRAIFLITVFVIGLGIAACGGTQSLGTDSGNPDTLTLAPDGSQPPPAGVAWPNDMDTETGKLAEITCHKIFFDCYPGLRTKQQCLDLFMPLKNMSNPLGLFPSEPRQYLDIMLDEVGEVLRPNLPESTACRAATAALSCSIVAQAFDPALPDDLSRVAGMFPDEHCPLFFGNNQVTSNGETPVLSTGSASNDEMF